MPRVMTRENLERLEIGRVRARAEAAGFVAGATLRNGLAILMSATTERGEVEFLLPVRNDIGDYALRMSDAIAAIAIVEDNEPVDILRELLGMRP